MKKTKLSSPVAILRKRWAKAYRKYKREKSAIRKAKIKAIRAAARDAQRIAAEVSRAYSTNILCKST